MTITKAGLIKSIYNTSNLPTQESMSVVESLLENNQKNLGIRGRCHDQRLREILFEG